MTPKQESECVAENTGHQKAFQNILQEGELVAQNIKQASQRIAEGTTQESEFGAFDNKKELAKQIAKNIKKL